MHLKIIVLSVVLVGLMVAESDAQIFRRWGSGSTRPSFKLFPNRFRQPQESQQPQSAQKPDSQDKDKEAADKATDERAEEAEREPEQLFSLYTDPKTGRQYLVPVANPKSKVTKRGTQRDIARDAQGKMDPKVDLRKDAIAGKDLAGAIELSLMPSKPLDMSGLDSNPQPAISLTAPGPRVTDRQVKPANFESNELKSILVIPAKPQNEKPVKPIETLELNAPIISK